MEKVIKLMEIKEPQRLELPGWQSAFTTLNLNLEKKLCDKNKHFSFGGFVSHVFSFCPTWEDSSWADLWNTMGGEPITTDSQYNRSDIRWASARFQQIDCVWLLTCVFCWPDSVERLRDLRKGWVMSIQEICSIETNYKCLNSTPPNQEKNWKNCTPHKDRLVFQQFWETWKTWLYMIIKM